MAITEAFNRDANQVPITGLDLVASKAITYVTSTTGATGTTDLFTVTGTVALRIFAVCSTNLVGSTATLEAGIAGLTAGLLAQTTAEDIDASEVWIDTVPAKIETLPSRVVMTSGTIIQTIDTAALSAGVLTYYCS